MRVEDVPEVSQVDRRCFTNPWPQTAYRRELRNQRNNYYIVLRKTPDEDDEPKRQTDSSSRLNIFPFRRKNSAQTRNDPIVGFCGMWIMFDEAHITTIGVDPEYRGNGLGEYLMVMLFEEAMRRGADWVTLEVRVSNTQAQSLYRKYGFTQQGVRRRYYSDNGEDAYIMWSPRIRDPEFVSNYEQLRAELDARLQNIVTDQVQPLAEGD